MCKTLWVGFVLCWPARPPVTNFAGVENPWLGPGGLGKKESSGGDERFGFGGRIRRMGSIVRVLGIGTHYELQV